MEIKRLKAENYDELLGLLNTVFGTKNNKQMNFEAELPKMCVRDDEHVGKHFGVFEDGKLCSALGIYPIPVNICGCEVLFSTVGNVATLPEYEGRGFMKALMGVAMEELERIGADASRLGGRRARYARYGYEISGLQYEFSLIDHNVSNYCRDFKSGLTFTEIKKDDLEALEHACNVYEKQPFYAKRSRENNFRDMYCSMTAWRNIPYIVRDESGNFKGYLCTTPEHTVISEIYAETDDLVNEIIIAWQLHMNDSIKFTLRPHNVASLRFFSGICESFSVSSPCRFKIINYEKIVSALLRLKAEICPLTEADFSIEIKEYGKLHIFSDGKNAYCEKWDDACDVTLDKNSASRFLFGPLEPFCTAETSKKFGNILPLPLSWNLQDRV